MTDDDNPQRVEWATEMLTHIGLGIDAGAIDEAQALDLLETLASCLQPREREQLWGWYIDLVRWYEQLVAVDT